MPEDFRYSDPSAAYHPLWKRLLLRFVLCYLCLYCLDLFGDAISFCVFIARNETVYPVPFANWIWRYVVPWVGAHVLHLGTKIAVSDGGSGDTLFDWVRVLCELVIAGVAALVWSAVDKGRWRECAVRKWLTIAVRTLLAMEMILYGMDKVFPLQFGELNLSRMIQPMSAKTPMGVLWDYMAASVGYTIFVGLVEVVGGALLMVRRWTTLGALICLTAMVNVFALNLAYDIPVKRYSLHFVLLSLFLLAPVMPRLTKFFILNRGTEPEVEEPVSTRRWVNHAAIWVPVLLCTVVFGLCTTLGFKELSKRRTALASRGDFYGVWDFVALDVADASKPLLTDKLMKDLQVDASSNHWRRLIFEGGKTGEIELGGNVMDTVKVKAEAGTVTLTDNGDANWKCVLQLKKTSPGMMDVSGMVNGNAVKGTLRREDETQFALTRRRFHWVNEW